MASKSSDEVVVNLTPIQIRTMEVKVIGDASLVCHAWDEKTKKAILSHQLGHAKQGKRKKDPEGEFRASLYHLPNGKYGFPSVAFKAAAVAAAQDAGLKMTFARRAFHVNGEFVEIIGKPVMRSDMVRVGMGSADIRFRGEFKEWSAVLPIRFNASVITPEQIINLINLAGFGVGVGEGRPEKDRAWGLFHVAGEAP